MQARFKLIEHKQDCYINLPASLAEQIPNSTYNQQQICVPVKITLRQSTKHRVLHLGYTGGLSEREGEIEISAAFAKSLQIHQSDFATVERANTHIPPARKLRITVSKVNDYQIVSVNKGQIETQLLNQIQVLFDGIVFPVVFGNHCVEFKYESS